MSTSTPDQTKPAIVLVHGLWMTPRGWEHWVERYASMGLAWATNPTAAESKQAAPAPA